MDFGKFDERSASEEGATLSLTHPETGTPLFADDEKKVPCTITLRGAESRQFKTKAERFAAKRVVRLNEREATKVPLTEDQILAEAEIARSDSLDLLASAVVAWTGINWEGEAMTCNEFNARKLFKAQPFIHNQVDLFVGTRTNFFTNA